MKRINNIIAISITALLLSACSNPQDDAVTIASKVCKNIKRGYFAEMDKYALKSVYEDQMDENVPSFGRSLLRTIRKEYNCEIREVKANDDESTFKVYFVKFPKLTIQETENGFKAIKIGTELSNLKFKFE